LYQDTIKFEKSINAPIRINIPHGGIAPGILKTPLSLEFPPLEVF
jgi:hypothetical protein